MEKTADQRATERIRQQKEVDQNYAVFKEKLLELFDKHPGEYALMKDGKILEIFNNLDKAVEEGNKRCKDGVFSAHKITQEIAHLGIYSYV